MSQFPSHCGRCGDPLQVSAMSRFNQDICCMPCLSDEQLAPGYANAKDAEHRAVAGGDMNFAGVGLSREDRIFLAERLTARRAAARKKVEGASA